MFDINNLQGEYRTGRRIESGDALYILTPICRFSFVQLTEAKNNLGGQPRFGIDLIFETDPSKPTAVDTSIMMAVFWEAAQKLGVNPRQTPDGYTFGADDKTKIHFGLRYNKTNGEPYSGYTPSSLWLAAYSYPSAKASKVPCLGPDDKEVSPDKVIAGWYGRAIINLYKPQGRNMLAIGLDKVQIVAEGETFGGGGCSEGFGAVPGAQLPSPMNAPGQVGGVIPPPVGGFGNFQTPPAGMPPAAAPAPSQVQWGQPPAAPPAAPGGWQPPAAPPAPSQVQWGQPPAAAPAAPGGWPPPAAGGWPQR